MSFITHKDVQSIVLRAIGPEVKILNHSLQLFSKDTNGTLGKHHLLTVNVEETSSNNIGEKTRTFFIKTPPESPIIQDVTMIETLFREEVHFYKKIQPRMTKVCECQRWSPCCYLVNNDTLVFEDLRAQGYAIRSGASLDERSLRSALSTLARFHASSVAAESRMGKTFKEAYPDAFTEKMYETLTSFGISTKIGYDTIALLAEKFGLDSSLVPRIYDHAVELVRPEEGHCNVVCHSDLWKNNLMFDNIEPPNCVLVDYQLLRYASPTIDLGMLLYLNMTPEVRKKLEFNLFNHYYSVFRKTLLLNLTETKVPSYENILGDYKKHRLVGMAYAAIYLPALYLKPEIITSTLNNPVALDRWFYCNRIEIIQSYMNEDPNYTRKMEDVISDLMEEAKKIFKE